MDFEVPGCGRPLKGGDVLLCPLRAGYQDPRLRSRVALIAGLPKIFVEENKIFG